MNVIICLDQNNGMLFNNRRQSRDRIVRKNILEYINGAKLYMDEYSFKQFSEDKADNIVVIIFLMLKILIFVLLKSSILMRNK